MQIAIDSSPAGLDPHIVTAFNSVAIVSGTIYEGLTAIDKELQVTPGLAETWTVSADGLSYRFKLASGVTFHDGSRHDGRRRRLEPAARPIEGDRLTAREPPHRRERGQRVSIRSRWS